MLVVDAGPLYAYVDADDAHHDTCLAFLEDHPGPLVVPMLVVTEVTYLLASRLGHQAEVRLLGDMASGAFAPAGVDMDDWLRIAELVVTYNALPLGTIDASVVATCERLGVATVATLDRRHFSVVQPRHTAAFEMVP